MQVTRFEGNVSPKSVDVQVLRLRRKLAKRPNTRELIEADPGIGYRFTASVTRSKAGLVPTTVVAFAA
jgi:DNA-binding response OmpR family regulator